jgi:hypothetical protein
MRDAKNVHKMILQRDEDFRAGWREEKSARLLLAVFIVAVVVTIGALAS